MHPQQHRRPVYAQGMRHQQFGIETRGRADGRQGIGRIAQR
jgi:hypothetical protein